MAPESKVDHTVVENRIKDIIQDLFQLMVQTAAYDTIGPNIRSRDVLVSTIETLSKDLQTLHSTASSPSLTTTIPPEILDYVDQGRNPDIYTREFVELARRANQILKGKAEAFADFRDILADTMRTGVPEWKGEVDEIVKQTGGKVDGQ